MTAKAPEASDERLAGLIAELRARGARVTTARRSLLAALAEADAHHLTAADLTATVQRAHPDVHLSTIYRSLDSLEELGIVDHVHLGHGRAVYHLADDAHQHLVCEVCGSVIEVPGQAFDRLAESVRVAYGFNVRAHFAVVGRCAACAAANPPG